MKIVKAIREGRIQPNKPSATKPAVYAIWSDADQPTTTTHAMYMPAPQLPPPRTAESYNPPEEYVPTEEERAEWEATDKEDRKQEFLPAKYDALRKVPGYKDLVQEKFERCLDLYLAPRTKKVKLNIDPESLVPKLPAPKELRPFPVASTVQYRHPGDTRVRGVSVSPSGEWVASGSEDGSVRVWDLGNGREVWRWDLKSGPVHFVEWSPNKDEALLVADRGVEAIKWVRPSEKERERGILVFVEIPGTPKQISFHRKGDYFATVSTEGKSISLFSGPNLR
jgi:ribosome biogenesis protein ERB1